MRMPMKNEGAEIPSILVKIAELSIQLPFLTAAKTPKGMPITTAINIAENARSKVEGSAFIRMDHTSCFDWYDFLRYGILMASFFSSPIKIPFNCFSVISVDVCTLMGEISFR